MGRDSQLLATIIFVLKTSRNAMKHVVNEGGSHIRSFLDAMIAESSLLTVSLRTLGG